MQLYIIRSKMLHGRQSSCVFVPSQENHTHGDVLMTMVQCQIEIFGNDRWHRINSIQNSGTRSSSTMVVGPRLCRFSNSIIKIIMWWSISFVEWCCEFFNRQRSLSSVTRILTNLPCNITASGDWHDAR